MITLGGFYKRFKDPIEETYNEAGSGLQYTYHNAKNAEAFGVELDIRKNLDFIGLRGLSLVCNAAYIYSRVVSRMALLSVTVRWPDNLLTW